MWEINWFKFLTVLQLDMLCNAHRSEHCTFNAHSSIEYYYILLYIPHHSIINSINNYNLLLYASPLCSS